MVRKLRYMLAEKYRHGTRMADMSKVEIGSETLTDCVRGKDKDINKTLASNQGHIKVVAINYFQSCNLNGIKLLNRPNAPILCKFV